MNCKVLGDSLVRKSLLFFFNLSILLVLMDQRLLTPRSLLAEVTDKVFSQEPTATGTTTDDDDDDDDDGGRRRVRLSLVSSEPAPQPLTIRVGSGSHRVGAGAGAGASSISGPVVHDLTCGSNSKSSINAPTLFLDAHALESAALGQCLICAESPNSFPKGFW